MYKRVVEGDYTRRLEAVRELGKLFPGIVAPFGYSNRSLGLFAGIYLQTKWQKDSGRDEIPLWFFVNQSLTLAPFAYAQEFTLNPDESFSESQYVKKHPTRDSVHALIKQEDTCRAWKTYFRAARKGSYLQTSRLLWHAHTTAIRHALWQYTEELESVSVPREEIAFWQGWIRLILGLERVSPLTNDFYLMPLLHLTMPTHSPLGDPELAIADEKILKGTFLRFISRGYMDQKKFLQTYGRLPR